MAKEELFFQRNRRECIQKIAGVVIFVDVIQWRVLLLLYTSSHTREVDEKSTIEKSKGLSKGMVKIYMY